MKPIAVTESPRMFWLSSLTPTYQMIDSDAHRDRRDRRRLEARIDVAEAPSASLRQRAIDRLVRAVGRIVVCVDAAAELSTAMISSLSSGEPKTCGAEHAEHVVGVVDEQLLAAVGLRGEGRRRRR